LVNVSENCIIASVPNFPKYHKEHIWLDRGRKASRDERRPYIVEVVLRRMNMKLTPHILGVGAVEEEARDYHSVGKLRC
jgi:hypothetical protein